MLQSDVARALEVLLIRAQQTGGRRAYTHCPKHPMVRPLQPEADNLPSTCPSVVG